MRLMHLSDLHFGKMLLEQSLIDDQRYILEEIIKIIKEKKVDVVMISGDVYDKAIPNIEAVKLFSEFLTKLYKLGVKVFVIAGNHDSKDRLSFGNELFVDNCVYIEGVFNGKLNSVELEDEWGKVLIYMLPFVKPCDVRGYYPDEEIRSYDDAVRVIISNSDIDYSKRNILMIHQFVTANGVEIERSESETLSLGGIDNVDVSNFLDFDYVAMGHLHRGQKLIKDTIRYSGSLLKYSFSEVNHKKSIPIIELKEKGNVSVELVELNPIRDMRVIKGRLDNLLSSDVVTLGNVNDYISVILTDEDYIMDAIGKIRKVYKNVLRLEYQNKRSSFNEKIVLDNESNYKKSALDLFMEFYKKQNNVDLDDERLNIVKSVIKDSKDIVE